MIGKIIMLILIIIPIAEFYLLVEVGTWIGAMNTVAIVIITAMVGVSFARSQGLQILRRMQSATNQGQMPGRELVEGVLVLIGGFLLIIPGFITDVIGLTLLVPFTRWLYINLVLVYFRKKFRDGEIKVYPSYPNPSNFQADYYLEDHSEDYSYEITEDDTDNPSDDEPPPEDDRIGE